MIRRGNEIKPAQGKLGIALVGLGAVSTTFIAGVELIRKKLAKPIGSLTQMGHIRLGKRTDKKNPFVKDFVPLAKLEDLVFGAWDIFSDNAKDAAKKAGVLTDKHIEPIEGFLEKIQPCKAVFDQNYVKNLNGKNSKTET